MFYDGEQVVETVKNELMEIKELQEIKNVDYSKVPKNSYGCIGLETSRGCRFRCVFCSVLYKHIWRGLTEQYVVNNIMSQVETIKEKQKVIMRKYTLSMTVLRQMLKELRIF